MSSSPSRSSVECEAPQLAAARRKEVQPFAYDEVSESQLRRDSSETVPSPAEALDDFGARELRAREQGRQQGLAEARQHCDEQLGRERAAVAAALAEFTRDRAAYYAKIESEVVQLALSMARKILHREAQVDPMLLAGIARVALEKIEGATGVTLFVSPQQAADWRKHLALRMEPADLPEIVEDVSLEPERCRLRTSMGTADLGVEVQLKEIERGLADLLAVRPGAAS